MSELNDFLSMMASAKKVDPVAKKSHEIKENIQADLGGLFSQLSEAKKVDPEFVKHQELKKHVQEAVKADMGSLFAELASLKKQKKELLEEHPALEEVPVVEEIVAEEAMPEIPTPEERITSTYADVDKYLGDKTFQQPKIDPVEKEFKSITDKIKFLELAISKIAATGPGGGEVNFRYLDDVDRSTIVDGNYLTYNAETKKFEFREVVGGEGGVAQVQSDWNVTDNTLKSYIKNKPELFDGAYASLTGLPTLFSGSYNDLTDTPTLFSGSYNDLTDTPVALSEFTNDLSYISWTNPSPTPTDNFKTIIAAADGVATISLLTGLPGVGNIDVWSFDADKVTFPDASQQTTAWTGTYSYTNLTDKPTLFSGDYDDLTDKPTLFSGSYTDLSDKPTLFSGDYDDLTDKPTIPTTLSQLTNDANYIKSTELVNLTYTGTGSSSTLTIGGYNSKGGTGYHDFLKVTNGYGSATNANKWFRLNSSGGLEIVNSAYTATILELNNAGTLNVASYNVNGKQAVNGPSFSAYPTSPAQSIPAASNVRVNFGNEEYDVGGCYDAPNGKFLPNVEGYYQLNATVRIDGSSGTGERMIVIYKNGSEYKRGTNESGSEAASGFFTMSVSCQAYANGSSDYFQVYVVQNSGANRNVSEYQQISYFQGCMLRGA